MDIDIPKKEDKVYIVLFPMHGAIIKTKNMITKQHTR